MGNRLSRRRYAPTGAADKASAEQAPRNPTRDSAATPTQEVTEPENVNSTVAEPATIIKESESESKDGGTPATSVPEKDAEAELMERGSPLLNKPDDPTEQPVQAVVEPSYSGAEAEASPPPTEELVSAPTDVLELLNQEFEPMADMDVPDVTPTPAPTPVLLTPGETSDFSTNEQHGWEVKATQFSTEVQASLEVFEFPEKVKEEALEQMETLGGDGSDANVGEIFKNSEITGNNLLSDLIPIDVNLHGDSGIIDVSAPSQLL